MAKEKKEMSPLLARLKKASTIQLSDCLETSSIMERTNTPTSIPALNVILSGDLNKGLTSGVTVFCGESRTGKSILSLVCAKAYMDRFEDAVLLFYDSEMGASKKYFESIGIDPNRVLHTPITDIEMLKFDIVAQLEQIQRGDHVVIVIDSVGNLASKKETQDAIDQKSVSDLSRAKALKSFFRLVTPQVNFKDIPLVCISHSYQNISAYVPTAVLSGGQGILYSSDLVVYMSRSQEKQGTDLIGYNFNMTIMKSRHVREKAKIPLTSLFNGGISKWSGLLDMALASGNVISQTKGWYQRVNKETGEVEDKKYRAKETNCEDFWKPVLEDRGFQKWVNDTFSIANSKLLADNDTVVNEQFTDSSL